MSNRRSALRVFVGRYVIAFVVASVFIGSAVFAVNYVFEFIGSAVFAVNYVFDRKLDNVARVDVATAAAPPEGANYLVIGSDTRSFVKGSGDEKAFGDPSEESGQRSDTMMVVHVEPQAKRSLIVSFPRDLWVEIPGVGNSKINAAFNNGGPDKIIETLKENFGIDINHYIEVDFRSFQGVVKAIGNVPVYFPYPARDEQTGLFVYQPGCVRLDGPASLAYVRSRHLEYFSTPKSKWTSADATADIGRIKRQQDFIRRLVGLAVAKSLNDPFTANEIADRVVENLKADTGLSNDDFKTLIDRFRTINPNDTSALEFQTFPWKDGASQNGQSVLYPREEPTADGPGWRAVVDRLVDFSGNKSATTATPDQVSLKVLNGSGQTGAASAALREFKSLGYQTKGTGDDERDSVAVSEVRYRPGESAKATLVLESLPNARLVQDPDLAGVDVVVVLGTDFTGTIVRPSDTTTGSTPTDGLPTATTTPPPTTPPTTTPAEPSEPTSAERAQFGQPAPRTPPC